MGNAPGASFALPFLKNANRRKRKKVKGIMPLILLQVWSAGPEASTFFLFLPL